MRLGLYGQVLVGEIRVLLAQPEIVNFHQCQFPNVADKMSEVNGMEELTNAMPKGTKVGRATPVNQVQTVGMSLGDFTAWDNHDVETYASGKMGGWTQQNDCCLEDLAENMDDLGLELAKGHVGPTPIAHHDLPVAETPRFSTKFR